MSVGLNHTCLISITVITENKDGIISESSKLFCSGDNRYGQSNADQVNLNVFSYFIKSLVSGGNHNCIS